MTLHVWNAKNPVASVNESVQIGAKKLVLGEEVSIHAMKVLREHARNFKHVDKEDEPPLRVLDHGLFGEGAVVPEGSPPPHPHMIRRGDKYFLGYRFDQDLCDDAVHATPALRQVFGVGDKEADAIFRNTLGYASAGANFETADGGMLSRMLQEALLPAALEVFGVKDNPEARKLSRAYSLYANLLLPGQIINLHLDVPEFRGVDRSTCPNWLLVAAHCSGLFADKRVRNATAVFYPSTAQGGALAVYPSIRSVGGAGDISKAAVYPAERNLAVVMDADSCFHHSEQARHGGIPRGAVKEVPVPTLPPQCTVEVVEEAGEEPWWVVKDPVRVPITTPLMKTLRGPAHVQLQ